MKWTYKLVILAILLSSASTLQAGECLLDDVNCAGKCNIKFRNKTGVGSGWGGNIHNQYSEVSVVKVIAKNRYGDATGTKNIDGGDNKTMSLKRKVFSTITMRVDKPILIEKEDFFANVVLGCSDIKLIVAGSGTCTVFMAMVTPDHKKAYPAYSCNGGDIISARPF